MERRAIEQPETRQSRLERRRERDHERRAIEQPEARQSRLERLRERDHERRAMEQPEARKSRLERLRERDRQQRAAEQADARQARLTRNREANRRRRQAETQPELERTSMPALEDEWVQGKLAAFHSKISSLSFTVAAAMSHFLASSSPPVPLCVAAVHVTSKSLNSIQLLTTWTQVQCH